MIKKVLLLTPALAVMLFILLTPLSQIGQMLFDEDIVENTDPTVSPQELRSFLRLWSVYVKSDVSNYGAAQISLVSGDLNEHLPRRLQNWLHGNRWTPKRFFYVEQRVRSIVKTGIMLRHIEANRKILEREENTAIAESLRKIIAEQERGVNTEKVTPQELEMVKPDLDYINDILEGKAGTR